MGFSQTPLLGPKSRITIHCGPEQTLCATFREPWVPLIALNQISLRSLRCVSLKYQIFMPYHHHNPGNGPSAGAEKCLKLVVLGADAARRDILALWPIIHMDLLLGRWSLGIVYLTTCTLWALYCFFWWVPVAGIKWCSNYQKIEKNQ